MTDALMFPVPATFSIRHGPVTVAPDTASANCAGNGMRGSATRSGNPRTGIWLLRPRERPRDCRAAEQRDELAPLNFEHGDTGPCSVFRSFSLPQRSGKRRAPR